MAITTEQIKELREATGISVMQCKKALEEAEGDMEKALLILKKKSTEIAAKKSDREATAGTVVKAESAGRGLLLALRCETDFVAKNADFTSLAQNLADMALAQGVDAAQGAATELVSGAIQKLGENIQLGEIREVSAPVVGSYVHDGRMGVLVGLSGGTTELAKDIAMHIAAMNPEYKTRADVPADAAEKVKALFAEEVASSDKPAEIKEKMLAGKIDTFFKERTLMDQSFIKNPDMSVEALLKQGGATFIDFARIVTA
jgi:elongation factor Ts